MFTVSVADCHQRVRAIQSHAPYLRELRISPVNTLVEIINGQPCGRKRFIYLTNYTEITVESLRGGDLKVKTVPAPTFLRPIVSIQQLVFKILRNDGAF